MTPGTPEPVAPNSKRTILIFGLILVLVMAGFLYMLYGRSDSVNLPENGLITGVEGFPEGAVVEVSDRLNAELFANTPRPSLNRTLPRGGLPSDAYAILLKNREGAVSAITDTPAAMNNWVVLGLIHKQAGDYEGARIYWTYVSTVNPENFTAHWNLATLYATYLKDTTSAEREFKAAIALDVHYVDAYKELSIMYHSMGANDKALSILSEGLAQNPGNLDLLIARAHLYRDIGKKVEAASAYDAAIAQAKKEKNTALAATLTAEKGAL